MLNTRIIASYITLLFCLLISYTSGADSTQTIIYQGKILFPEDIGKKIQTYSTNHQSISIDSVARKHDSLFTSSTKDILNLGVTHNTYWLKCRIQNESKDDVLFLEIDNPILDQVSLFALGTDSSWKIQTVSRAAVFGERPIKSQKIIFPFRI